MAVMVMVIAIRVVTVMAMVVMAVTATAIMVVITVMVTVMLIMTVMATRATGMDTVTVTIITIMGMATATAGGGTVTGTVMASAHAGPGGRTVTFGFAPECRRQSSLLGFRRKLCRPALKRRSSLKKTALEEGPGPLRRVGRYAEITFPKREAHRFLVNQSLLPTPRIEFTNGKRLGGKPRGPDIGH